MKTFSKTLTDEHQTIYKVLAAMVSVADLMEHGTRPEAGMLAGMVQFLRIFAGACHQTKEDQYLFPLLETKGSPEASHQIKLLEREHHSIADLVNRFAANASIYTSDPEIDPRALIATMRNLAEAYSRHLWKEDYQLLPMSQRMLSGNEQHRLEDKFKIIDDAVGINVHHAFEQLANRLQLVVEYCDSGACVLCSAAA